MNRLKNINRSLLLKNNILKYNNLVNLPQYDEFLSNDFTGISGISSTKFNYDFFPNYNLDFNLQSDYLMEGKKQDDVLIKTIRILLLPNQIQKDLLISWMDAWIDTYNHIISIIKAERKRQSELLNKPIKYNQMNLNNLKLNKLRKDLQPFKNNLASKTKIDIHILDNCIKDVFSKLSSSITNLNRGNIKKSKLRYIKKTKKSKIFKVEYHSLRDNSFCTGKLGKILKSIPVVNYKDKSDGFITIQYINNKFYALIRQNTIIKNNIIKTEIISLDPGHKSFLTGLSNNHLIEIGKGIDKKIKKKLLKMDKIKGKRTKHFKYRRKSKRKYLLKHEKDITNYINNLHWQVVNYLTNKYNHILLGNYSTKSMVESKKSDKMNKRIGSSFKFYQFRQKLIYKCILLGCNLSVIDEYNTTKACSNCSTLNNIGSSRKYSCKNGRCLQEYPRDVNSCKNILLSGIVD